MSKLLNEKKKEYLNEYKKMKHKVESLQSQLEALTEAEESPKTQQLTDMPHGSNDSDLSDYMAAKEELEKEIDNASRAMKARMLDIEACIYRLEDGIESKVIHMRYIEFIPWERICTNIGYEWRNIHYIHSKALQNICISGIDSE